MQYIAYAQRGEFEKCAEESFDCVMCGICSSRCPAGISHPAGGHAGPPPERQVPGARGQAPGPSACKEIEDGEFNDAAWKP